MSVDHLVTCSSWLLGQFCSCAHGVSCGIGEQGGDSGRGHEYLLAA